MLLRLRIENLLLFAETEVVFQEGLNVISGETGAGKSVFLKALGLVLGDKASKDLIRPGAEEAYIEAFFDQRIPLFLEITEEDPVLARRLNKSSSRAFVSGRSCAAEVLAEGGAELIFLTGQHAAQKLSSPTYQRYLLDTFAQVDTHELQASYRLWQQREEDLQDLRKKLLALEERGEFLEHEKSLIEELGLEEGEEESLAEERGKLLHADKLAEKSQFIRQFLLDPGEDSLLVDLARAVSSAEEMKEHDPDAAELLDLLSDASLSLEAAGDLARGMEESYAGDPGRLEEIETRLLAISDLRRRYKNMTLAEINAHLEEIASELSLWQSGEEELLRLEEEKEEAKREYFALAKEVSRKRKKAAEGLKKQVEGELADLALADASFAVSLLPTDPGAQGLEKVEMLLSSNKGLEATPLGKGASGGELSRVNLALLLALPRQEGIVYVFDEVDAGIGGQTAHDLANKLLDLSKKNQVIVVTHLAQIAALADNHLAIEKQSSGDSTKATIAVLNSEERREEIARLLGLQKEDAGQATELLAAARRKR